MEYSEKEIDRAKECHISANEFLNPIIEKLSSEEKGSLLDIGARFINLKEIKTDYVIDHDKPTNEVISDSLSEIIKYLSSEDKFHLGDLGQKFLDLRQKKEVA